MLVDLREEAGQILTQVHRESHVVLLDAAEHLEKSLLHGKRGKIKYCAEDLFEHFWTFMLVQSC